MSGEPKDLARGTSTIAEEAVDQLQENEKLVAGESSLNRVDFKFLPRFSREWTAKSFDSAYVNNAAANDLTSRIPIMQS